MQLPDVSEAVSANTVLTSKQLLSWTILSDLLDVRRFASRLICIFCGSHTMVQLRAVINDVSND